MAPISHSLLRRARSADGGVDRPIVTRTLLAALVVVATFLSLSVTASPAVARGTIYRTATELDFSRAVLHELNAERQAHGLRPLRYDSRLRLSARWHNLAMARANTLSHQVAGEADFTRRIDRAGYHWTYAGENIGWNSRISKRGVVTLEKIMYHEKAPNDGHRQNILSRHYRNVGVDVYIDRTHHKVWLTTDFGHL
jgi:uncharacterized protein YkwD